MKLMVLMIMLHRVNHLNIRFEYKCQPYMIDPTFRNINRLFVLSIKSGGNDPTKNYFDKNYLPLVEIKDFNALIDIKPFFDQTVKNKQEVYEKRQEMMIA